MSYWNEKPEFQPYNLPLAAQAEWRSLKRQISALQHKLRDLEVENSSLRRKAKESQGITVIVEGGRHAARAMLGVEEAP